MISSRVRLSSSAKIPRMNDSLIFVIKWEICSALSVSSHSTSLTSKFSSRCFPFYLVICQCQLSLLPGSLANLLILKRKTWIGKPCTCLALKANYFWNAYISNFSFWCTSKTFLSRVLTCSILTCPAWTDGYPVLCKMD